MRIMHRKSLIDLIQENDKLIQCYIEEDYPKTFEELQKLTITELQDWFERRVTELQFLTEREISIE